MVEVDAVLGRPLAGVVEPTLGDADPRPQRRDRPDVGEVAGQEERLRLVQRGDRPVEVAARPEQSRSRDVDAVPVLDQ